MKSVGPLFLGALCVITLVNLTQKSNIDSKNHPDVNFSGHIKTRHGSEFDAENILIAGRYKQIPVYEKPQQGTDKGKLPFDPSDKRNAITSYLDLAEIKAITIDNPMIWVFEKEKGYARVEFVEITVINTNASDEEKTYLIKLNNSITCDEITKSGPIEKVVPFTAITNLTITNFRSKEGNLAERQCLQQCTNGCKGK